MSSRIYNTPFIKDQNGDGKKKRNIIKDNLEISGEKILREDYFSIMYKA